MSSKLWSPAAIWVVAVWLVTFVPRTMHAVDGTGSVSGRVILDGVPLAEGKLLLHKPGEKEKATIQTPIKGGKFMVEMVATGKYAVTIQGAGVPARYTSPDVSGLMVEVNTGNTVFEFSLTSK
jgi:hypothetical protein